jgi:hypothetical protein
LKLFVTEVGVEGAVDRPPSPFTFFSLLAGISIFHSSQLYPPASSFNSFNAVVPWLAASI